jgi:hypothetical protein
MMKNFGCVGNSFFSYPGRRMSMKVPAPHNLRNPAGCFSSRRKHKEVVLRFIQNDYGNRFGSRIVRGCATVVAGIVAVTTMMAGGLVTAAYAEPVRNNAMETETRADSKHFMVYYRAWRDITMKGVNTDLPDDNWISMYDIPYGIDVVNVFSYVPSGQEEQAQPFYDKLKAEYAPYLHGRGIKLVRGLDYRSVMVDGFKKWISEQNKTVETASDADYDAYADHVIATYMTSIGLDGLDIDMETRPDNADVAISDKVITSLSKRIGPKSSNPQGTMFLYDTNGSYTKPFENVAGCFDYVAYQQYGSDSKRTASASSDYAPYVDPGKFVPGLTFPEEGDMNNRWYDATEPYLDSHIYDVASYSYQNNLGGMFLYALDRDGRTYSDDDLNHIKPSNLIWTKTAIAESQGMALESAKSAAKHFLNRMQYLKEVPSDIRQSVDDGTTLYDVNKAVLGGSWNKGFSNTYDPTLELSLTKIDSSALETGIAKADGLLADSGLSQELTAQLQKSRDDAVSGLTGKSYTAKDVEGWRADLQTAIDAIPLKPDLTTLQGLADKVGALKESDYTADSWKQLSDALQSANVVLADGNATQQQVDDASNKLRDAIGALKNNEPKKDDPGKEEPKKGERLSDTGSTVVGVFALAVLMAVAGVGVSWLNRRRSLQ